MIVWNYPYSLWTRACWIWICEVIDRNVIVIFYMNIIESLNRNYFSIRLIIDHRLLINMIDFNFVCKVRILFLIETIGIGRFKLVQGDDWWIFHNIVISWFGIDKYLLFRCIRKSYLGHTYTSPCLDRITSSFCCILLFFALVVNIITGFWVKDLKTTNSLKSSRNWLLCQHLLLNLFVLFLLNISLDDI